MVAQVGIDCVPLDTFLSTQTLIPEMWGMFSQVRSKVEVVSHLFHPPTVILDNNVFGGCDEVGAE